MEHTNWDDFTPVDGQTTQPEALRAPLLRESDLRDVVAFNDAEHADSVRSEAVPGWSDELDRAIAEQRDPAKRALLIEERKKRSGDTESATRGDSEAVDWSAFTPVDSPKSDEQRSADGDYNPLAAINAPKVDDSGFAASVGQGLSRGVKQSAGLFGGASALVGETAEEAVGKNVVTDWMQRAGQELYQRKMEESAGLSKSSSFTDLLDGKIELKDWLGDSLGYLGYQVAESVATAGAGAIVGKTLGKGVIAATMKAGIEKEVQRLAASEAGKSMAPAALVAEATKNVATRAGAATGLYANNLRQEGGSIHGEAQEQDAKTGEPADLARQWLAALTAAGIDTGAEVFLGQKVLGTGQARAGNYGARLAKELGAQGAVQGGTEFVQTGIERFGAKQDLDSPEAWRDYLDSTAVGTLGGFAGAPAAALPKAAPAERKPNSPLTNAVNAARAEAPAAPADPSPVVQAPGLGSPELDAKHAQLAAIIGDPAKLAELRAVYPAMPADEEILHVWNNIINNRELPLETRVGALNQGYSMLVNTPDFTVGGNPGRGRARAPQLGVDETIEGEARPVYDDRLPGRNAAGARWDDPNPEMRDMAAAMESGALTSTPETTDPKPPASAPKPATLPDLKSVDAAFAAGARSVGRKELITPEGQRLVLSNAQHARWLKLLADRAPVTPAATPAPSAAGVTDRTQPAVSTPVPNDEPAPRGLSIGRMPNTAEPITVKGGVVHIGAYPAQDYDSGADITVGDNPTPAQIRDALRAGGAIGNGLRIFGVPAEAKRTAPTASRSVDPARDSLFMAVAKLGGMVKSDVINGWGHDPKDFRNGRLMGFNRRVVSDKGMSADGMLEALKQYGYFADDATLNDFELSFRDELSGNLHFTPEGHQFGAEQAAEAQHQAALDAADITDGSGVESFPDDIQDELEAAAEALALSDIPLDEEVESSPEAEIAGLRSLGFTEQEIIDELAKTAARTQDTDRGHVAEGAGRPAVESPTVRTDDGGAFALAAETNGDVIPVGPDGPGVSKPQADRERDAVPFSLAQESQPKPSGVQSGLFTADGRPAKEAVTDDKHDISSAVSSADRLGLKGKDRKSHVVDALSAKWGMLADEVSELPEVDAALKKGPNKNDLTAANERAVEKMMLSAQRIAAEDRAALSGDLNGVATEATPMASSINKVAEAIDAKIDEVSARLAEKLKAKRSALNSGIDPELLVLGAELGALYIGKGFVTFAQYGAAIINKMKSLGVEADEIRPLLKEFYLATQAKVDDAIFDRMDDARKVRAFDLASIVPVQEAIAVAEKTTDINPSPAQKAAENYRKGKFDWHGLTIAVETPKGAERTDKETNGDKWRVTMPATYGYILGTVGADKDHVDVFVGDQPESGKVFIIDQNAVDSTTFDEHKVMVGFSNEQDAVAAYMLSFADRFGDRVFGRISSPLTIDQLKDALPSLKKKRPFTEPEAKEFNLIEAAPAAPEPARSPLVKVVDNTEPANWRKNWGAASRYAESLGVAVRNANKKYKKFNELVADIDAHLAGASGSTNADIAPGLKAVAQRQINAANQFIESVVEQFGLTKEEAGRAWDYFVQHKLVNIDAVGGQYTLKDGRLWDAEAMRRAVDLSTAPAGEPKSEARPAKPDAPGTRVNTASEKAIADRLDQIAEPLMHSGKPVVSGTVLSLRSVATELRKEKTAVSVAEILETASQRLYSAGYAVQSDVIDEIVEQLRGAVATSTRKLQPGEPGYTLTMAEADLEALSRNTGEFANVENARVTDQIRRQEKLIAEMKAESNQAGDGEPEFSVETQAISQDTGIKERGNEHSGNGGTRQESLAPVSPGVVPDADQGRAAGSGSNRVRGTDATRNGRADEDAPHDQPGSVDGVADALLPERPADTVEIAGETYPLESVAEQVKHNAPASEPKGAALTGTNPGNYAITDDDRIGQGTTGERIRNNLAAIRLVLDLEREQRYATPDEQAILVKYVGWGGLKNVFKPNSDSKQERDAFAELKGLLTEPQLFWMGQTVLDAHYTSPKIIRTMYKILRHMGVTGGRFLEPTVGSGNFIGLMPDDMAASAKWYASEIDPITSLIAKHAYPDAQVLTGTGFQDAEFAYGRFDVAIGNPPFGDQTITDTNPKRAEINGQKIHNYVISKAGMHLRPGGVMAMVVTSRFLDTSNPEARDFLSKSFRFLGAIRLPNTAFKEGAGTEVTTDLVFMQKLQDGQAGGDASWLDVNGRLLNEDGETVTLNRYFAEHPDHMLGKPSMQGTMYGSRTEKGEFTLQPIDGLDAEAKIDELLADAWADQRGIARKRPADADAQAAEVMLNREDVPIGGFFREGERILERLDDDASGNAQFRELTPETPWTAKQTLGKKRMDRIRGILALRDDAYNLMYLERIDRPTEELDRVRAALNKRYDAFVAEHGFLNSAENVRLFADDARIEFGLESNYRKPISAMTAQRTGGESVPESATKSALLVERVFYPTVEIDHADTPRDGYAVSLSQRGRLDLSYIAELTGQTRAAVIDDLSSGDHPLIFNDPATGEWVQEDAYLSGNVKAKLREARAAGLAGNVRALEAVQPADVPPGEVHAEFGATWIPAAIYADFLKMLGHASAKVVTLQRSGQVEVASVGSRVPSAFAADLENPDYSISSLFAAVANRRPLVAYDGHAETRVVNHERTENLKRIARKLLAIWSDWIRADDARADLLAHEYNEKMNTTVERVFDGVTHLRTVGTNPAIQLRNSQKNSAWRMIQTPVILKDHVVGAGKTMALITGLMERVRLGLSRKPMVVVPNHLVGQWARDWMQLYPGANILAATEKDFSKQNRRRLFARIATGKFDAVIVGHSSFGYIPVEREAEVDFMMAEVEHLQAALDEAERDLDSGGKKATRTVRAIKNRIAKRLEKIKSLQAKPRDNVATFEDMGIDYIAIDESHEFKNLEYSTTLSNIAGMGSPEGSKKAFDLYMKVQLITQRDGGVAFATGTPLSNSMVEMYTVLRYLNRSALEERQLTQFDAWAKTFASIESRDEYTAAGKIKARTVMAAFNNLPELLQMYKQVADMVTMRDLKRIYAEQMRAENAANGTRKREDFPVPKVKDGGRRLDMGEPTALQVEFMDYLMARADVLDKKKGKAKQEYAKIDNALWLMNDARKMSLDVRTSDPTAPDEPDNKVNRAAKNIKAIYDRTHKDRGTQLVFCDLSTPAKVASKDAKAFIKKALEKLGLEKNRGVLLALENQSYQDQWSVLAGRADQMLDSGTLDDATRERIETFIESVSDEDMGALITADSGFSVYDALKEKLIAQGIPEREIAFIHDAGTAEKKRELFDLVNAGKVRVLIGSSQKMGAGTNAQERVVALHHLDAPWRPSDMEQREGRVIRQGNKLYLRDPDGFYVEIIAYSTSRTFDAQMWAVLARKAGFLEQFRMGLRSIKEEGGDAAGYAEFMAEATGNPIFREKIVLERDIDDLEAEERSSRMKLDAARRAIETADAVRQGFLDNIARVKPVAESTITSVTFEGATYANDLAQVMGEQQAIYQEEVAAYDVAHEAYKAERAAWEAKGTGSDRGRAPRLPEKPEYPESTSARVRAKSEWARLVGELAMRFSVVSRENGGRRLTLTTQDGHPIHLEATPTYNEGDVDLSIDDVGFLSQGAPLSLRIQQALRANAFVGAFQRAQNLYEHRLAALDTQLEQARLTIERIKPVDPERIAAAKARYAEVAKEVDAIATQLAAARAERPNRYIDKDVRRFPNGVEKPEASGAPSVLSRSLASNVAEFPGGIEAPAADALTARLLVNLGAVTTDHVVVQAFSELPEQVQAEARAQNSDEKATKGVLHQGTMYIVADNIQSISDLERTVLHEMIGHQGLRKVLGPEFVQKTNALFFQLGGIEGLMKIAAENGFGEIYNEYITGIVKANKENPAKFTEAVSRAILTEEVFAHLAETKPNLYQKAQALIGWVRDWLRAKGFAKLAEYGETDILHLLNRARSALRGPDGDGPKGGETPTVLRRSAAEIVSDTFGLAAKTHIADDSGKDYTPEQRAFFARVGREVTQDSLPDRLRALWQDAGKKMAQGLVDQFAPIKAISEGAYTLLRLSKGAAGAFEAFLHHGKLRVDKDGVYDADQSGGVIDTVFAPIGAESGDFLWWVAANRAERLAGEDRENLFTDDDIAAGKSLADGQLDFDYTLKHGPKAGQVTRRRQEVFADTLISFNAFHTNAMDVAEQSGLIDGEARQYWEHEFYIPFYRATEDEGGFKGANIKNGMVRQTAFKRLKGGSGKLNADLLENTLQNWAHLIDASAKNRAAKASLEAAVAVGAAVKVSASAIPTGSKNAVWHMGQNVRTIPKGATYEEGGETKVSDGTAQISEHGQVHYMVSDPFILTALTSLEYAGLRGPMMNAMSTMKHWLTVGVTASPAFKVRNLIRDSLQAIGTADLNYNPLANIRQGFAASDRSSQNYVSMLASGGLIRFGTMMEGREADRVRQLIKNGVEGSTILDSESKLKQMYDRYIEPAIMAYNELGNRSEEITRAALYEQLVAQGKSHAYASLMARDLMDFSMQGAWTSVRFLTQIVPFMNARMQGLYKLGRAAHDDPRRFGIVLGATAIFSIGLMAAYGDDDDWKKREDWDRDNFWWFKLGDTAFRIPKPFEIGAIATLAERGVELFASDEMTTERFLERLRELTLNNLAMNPVPQIVKPIIDIYANKDSFSGRPIETMGMERVRPEYRYSSSTSMPARAMSTAGNAVAGLVGGEFLSPVQIDFALRGYFGWLGSFIVGGTDSLLRSLSNEPSRPNRDLWKFATQGFISETGGASSRYVSQMYEQARILEQAHGTYLDLIKRGRTDEAAEFASDHQDELRRYRRIEQTKKAETVLNRAIRNVEANPNLSPEEKKERIRQYQAQKDAVAKRVAVGV